MNYDFLKKELSRANKQKKLHEIVSLMSQKLEHLPKYLSEEEKLFWYSTNLTKHPLCYHPTCNNEVKWVNFSKGYSLHCSILCARNNPIILKKREETNLKKFGEKYPSQAKHINEKTKQAFLNKYNTTNPMKHESVKQKYAESIQKLYNVDNISKHSNVKEKKKNTFSKKYNGALSPFQIDQEKIKAKWRENHGVDNPLKCQEIMQKATITKKQKNYLNLFNNNIKPLFSFEEYCDNKRSKWQCSRCQQHIYAVTPYIYCTTCDKINTKNKWEYNFSSWLKSLGISNIVTNNKQIISPYELDVFLPEYNIAFELNGLKWHGETNIPEKNYHLTKTILCLEKNIQLLHIFDWEWNNKRTIIKSRIKNKLNIQGIKIQARKCTTKLVSVNEKNAFLEENHVQGKCNSSINIGLYHNNQLYGLMSFGKPRFNKKYEYELLRLCFKVNTVVIGGSAKLWKFFATNFNPTSCISYSDRRWGASNVYHHLGFSFSHNSKIGYYYSLNGFTLENRLKYQKHKLTKLSYYNKELSEWENMKNNGYDRIWDCGNEIWTWGKF